MLEEADIKNLRKAANVSLPVSVMTSQQKHSYRVLQACGLVEAMNYCGTGRTCYKTTDAGNQALTEALA